MLSLNLQFSKIPYHNSNLLIGGSIHHSLYLIKLIVKESTTILLMNMMKMVKKLTRLDPEINLWLEVKGQDFLSNQNSLKEVIFQKKRSRLGR